MEKDYDQLYAGIAEEIPARQLRMSDADADADPAEVARQIARVVGLPKGSRPFRVHIDPMHDGAEAVFGLGDRIRADFYRRIGFEDLLSPAGACEGDGEGRAHDSLARHTAGSDRVLRAHP